MTRTKPEIGEAVYDSDQIKHNQIPDPAGSLGKVGHVYGPGPDKNTFDVMIDGYSEDHSIVTMLDIGPEQFDSVTILYVPPTEG